MTTPFQTASARLISAALFLLASCLPMGGQTETNPIQHLPLVSFIHGESVLIRASSSVRLENVKVLYRYEGIVEFQARRLDETGDGAFEAVLDSSQFPGLLFEYYIEGRAGEDVFRLPALAPEDLYRIEGESSEPLPDIPSDLPGVEEARRFRFPASVSGSVMAHAYESEDSGQDGMQASGNIRLFTDYQRETFGYNIDLNHSYTNQALPGENSLDLSSMTMRISLGRHTMGAGDLNIDESEYSVTGLGRRGVEYLYNDQRIYVHVFDVNSQQPKGYDGFGIPKAGISIMGGAIGYSLFNNRFNIKAVYVTGKDDPDLGINLGFDAFHQARKGNVYAIVQETSLFDSQLTLVGEYASSRYDGDLDDDLDARSDSAWKVGGEFNWKSLMGSANYRFIGKDFNPIGYQYFTNNRKSLDANLGLNWKTGSINGTYMYAKDNVEEDPDEYQTSSRNANLSLMWNPFSRLSVNVAYTRDKQNTKGGLGEFIFLQDSLSNQIEGSVSYMMGQWGSLSLSVVNVFQSSPQNPQSDMRNLTLNLGGSLRFGQWLSFMPTLGYTEMENRFTHDKQRTYNSFVNAEISILPQILSTAISGSYTRSEMGPDAISTTITLTGNLSFFLQDILKFGNIILSLRANYNDMDMAGFADSFTSILAQVDFSF